MTHFAPACEEQPLLEKIRSTISLRCPQCLGDMISRGDDLVCSNCNREYAVIDGIPLLRQDQSIYYGEFPQGELQRLLDEMEVDMESSLRRYLRERDAPPRLGEYILGLARAGWKYLLPISEESRVLDLGCGWGTLAYSLAQSAGEVVAVDSTLERMRLLKIRADKDEIRNIQLVCAGDGRYLPFGEGAFDLVVINGVLEWVPSGISGDPKQVQMDFLKEIRRVLKPTGTLFVGIENRYAWKTWFMHSDGHTGLKYVPWMPRWLANAYSIAKGKGPYRNYLYGKEQYRNLLHSCGFEDVKFFVPLPGYHHPTSMVPLEEKHEINQQTRRMVSGARDKVVQATKGFLASHFPDAFGIVASRGQAPSFLERLSREIQERYGLQAPTSFKYRMNGEMGMVTVIYRGKKQESSFVLKLPMHARGLEELKLETNLLQQIHAGEHSLAPMHALFPSVLGHGYFGRQFYSIFSLMGGVSGDKVKRDRKRMLRALENGIGAASKLHQYGCNTASEQDMTWQLSELHRLVSSLAHNQQQLKAVDEAVRIVERTFTGFTGPLQTYGHGDFKFANILFDDDSLEVVGIIDWGASRPGELIGYDVHFLVVDYQRLVSGRSVPELLRLWVKAGEIEKDLDLLLEGYANRNGFVHTKEIWQGVAAYQWLKRMAPMAGPYEAQRFNHKYLDVMFGVFD